MFWTRLVTTVGDELVERLHVVRDPADDRTRPVALVVAEREPLQVREQPLAQVGEDALADPAGEVRLGGGEDERADPRKEEEHDDLREPVEIPLRDPLVDGELGEIGRSEADDGEGEQRGHGGRRPQAVRPREADEQADPSSRPPPRPVVHLRAALLQQVRARLPPSRPWPPFVRRFHAETSTCWSSPCS